MAGVAAGAIIGVLTATGSAVAAHQTAIKGRRQQAKAQKKAQSQALSTKRQNAQAGDRASRKKPDIGAIIAANQSKGGGGISSTDLSGSSGMYTPPSGGSSDLGGY